MTNRRLCAVVAAFSLSLLLLGTAHAAELLYYVSADKGAPPDAVAKLKTPENEEIVVAVAPVATIKDSEVKEAIVVKHAVEVLDEDDPVSAVYRVTLVLDEAQQAKLAQQMDLLCKVKPGVHIAIDGVVFDYRPFAICGHFRTEVSFLDEKDAEAFAKRFTPNVKKGAAQS